MFQSDEEIYLTVIGSALLMVFLSVVMVIAIVKYQNRLRKHVQEVHDLQSNYQQEVLKAQLEMKEQTLQAISQEIHDNIGQVLSLAKLNLNTIYLKENSEVVQKIMTTKDLVGKAIQDLRNLSKSLNAEHISRQKLSELLAMELTLIKKSGSFTVDLQIHGNERTLDPQKQLIIFRIVQETFNNIIKHAQATNITVVLNYLPESLKLDIQDNGVGFDVSHAANVPAEEKGTGTYNMQYRARLIGAKLSINSKSHHGTLIQLSIPTP